MGILDTVDFLLDLHSTSGPSIPFLFSERHHLIFAQSLGISHIIGGWNDLGSDSTAGDTENYVNARGGVGFTFEAGNHSCHWQMAGLKSAGYSYDPILEVKVSEIISYEEFESSRKFMNSNCFSL